VLSFLEGKTPPENRETREALSEERGRSQSAGIRTASTGTECESVGGAQHQGVALAYDGFWSI
jgi:hypothetical protein